MILSVEEKQRPAGEEIKKRFYTICDYLCQSCYGQEDLIKLSLLFAIAKENIYIDYPSNDEVIIKELIHDRILKAFGNNFNKFEYLKGREDYCGINISAKKLSDEDYLDYITTGHISELTPAAEQNTLLTQTVINDWQEYIDSIPFSNCVKQLILSRRTEIEILYAKRIIHLARTSAFLNGRNEVHLTDFCNLNYLEFPYERLNYSEYLEYGGRGGEFGITWSDPGKLTSGDSVSDSIKEFQLYVEENCKPDSKKESGALNEQKGLLKSKYKDVLDKISERFTFIADSRKELTESNYFNRQTEIDEVLKSFDAAEKNLKETEKLVKEQFKNIEFSYVSDINLGDCICKDGSVSSKAGMAIICLKENTADSIFGITTEQWNEKNFAEASTLASEYNCNGSNVYASGWILPSIEQLEQIYKNLSESDLSELKNLLKDRYWSSTKKDDNAVYYFDFSTGKKDYTTPDHKYNAALLHQFYCGEE